MLTPAQHDDVSEAKHLPGCRFSSTCYRAACSCPWPDHCVSLDAMQGIGDMGPDGMLSHPDRLEPMLDFVDSLPRDLTWREVWEAASEHGFKHSSPTALAKSYRGACSTRHRLAIKRRFSRNHPGRYAAGERRCDVKARDADSAAHETVSGMVAREEPQMAADGGKPAPYAIAGRFE